MYPILLSWGPIILPSWHVFYVIGAMTGWAIFDRLLQKSEPELAARHSAWLFAACYICGYFGARALSILVEEPDHRIPFLFFAALFQFGAMTLYGGLLGGFLAGLGYLVVRKIPFGPIFDAAVPAIMVGLGFGRIGCFLNGDDFGKAVVGATAENSPWWSVIFPNLEDHLPRYPVQLWEVIFGFGLAALLVAASSRIRRVLRPGAIGVLGTLAYAIFRFWNERYRGDFRGWILENVLSTSQVISALIILLIIGLIPLWLRKPQTGQTHLV